ncbi:MAG TPA: ParA family protein [Candidatus Acidoferrales bacterium]|nr:ParA family protein [Candidatus Acidoferrales bacterium]
MAPHLGTFPKVTHKMLISKARTVAIVNQKGGVGKTTTVINLGAALAELGVQVLVVDLDPQSNSTSGLGVDPRRARPSTYQLLSGEADVDQVAVPTSTKGLYLLPAQMALVGAEIELATQVEREFRLRRALDVLDGGYGFILIDCPPSLGLLTLNALAAADEILVPMQAEYFALEGLAHLIQTQRMVRLEINPQLRVGGILLTQFDPRTTLSWDVLAEVRRAYGELVFKSVIPRNVRVGEASSHGRSVLEFDPSCKGAKAYRNLAAEVLER